MGNQNSKFRKSKDKIIMKLYKLFTKNSMFYSKTKLCFVKLIKIIQIKEFEKKIIDKYKNIDNIDNKINNLPSIDNYIEKKKLLNSKKEIIKENFIKLISMFSFKDINRLLSETKRLIFEELIIDYDNKNNNNKSV